MDFVIDFQDQICVIGFVINFVITFFLLVQITSSQSWKNYFSVALADTLLKLFRQVLGRLGLVKVCLDNVGDL